MNSRTIQYLVIVVLAAPLGGAVPSWAADTTPDAGKSFSMPPVAKLVMGNLGRLLVLRSELNVTDTQRSEIAQSVRKHRNEIRPVAASVLEKRRALREAVLSNPGDEAAIRKAAADLGKAIGDAAVVGSKVIAEARTSFTPQQIEAIAKFKKDCDGAADSWVKQIGNIN